MKFRYRFILLCCAILASITAITPGQAFSSDQHIKFAVLPCSDVVKTFERFKPLVAYLEQETGLAIQTIFPKNKQELADHLKNKTTDFVFQSPYIYKEIAGIIDKKSLLKALSPEGSDFQTGYLVVRKDSGLEKIPDLKGGSVIFGMECSASRWTAGKKLFADHGIDIETDLKSYADGGCCEDICFNVFLKAANAGLVCKHYFDEQKALHSKHTEGLTVLGETDPMPTRIFAARKDIAPEIIAAVKKALLAISRNAPKYEELIKLTEISGFVKADPLYYETLGED